MGVRDTVMSGPRARAELLVAIAGGKVRRSPSGDWIERLPWAAKSSRHYTRSRVASARLDALAAEGVIELGADGVWMLREPERSLPADDELVWIPERRHGVSAHSAERSWERLDYGERITAGDARRAYAAVFCYICWPLPEVTS